MPYWRSFAPLVWTTKNREPLIRQDIEGPLHAALVSKAAELGCYVHAINGTTDHVHLVISIPPKHSVAWVVKNLKGNSSHLANHALPAGTHPFAWQRGYGYLSLGESQCDRAIAYVNNQKQHHSDATTTTWLEKVTDGEDETLFHPTGIRERAPAYGLPF
jgi:putative transposase